MNEFIFEALCVKDNIYTTIKPRQMAKQHPYLSLVPDLPKDHKEPQHPEKEALNTLLKAVLIGVGVGGGIEAMVACFPNDIMYLMKEDFPYRLITAATITGLMLPMYEKGIKEGEEPKDYFIKVMWGASGYIFATTMMYSGIETIMK